MKIEAVNSTPSRLSLKSTIFNSFETSKSKLKTNNNERDILIGLAALSVLGTAVIISNALKKRNLSPFKIVNNAALNLKKKHAKKPQPDPLYIYLDGKRDTEAVRIYNAYTSRQKLHSLEKRFAAGEFLGKGESLDYINNHKERLQRVSKNVI